MSSHNFGTIKRANHYQQWLKFNNKDGGLGDPSKEHGVKHRNVLYNLPYWQVCIISLI